MKNSLYVEFHAWTDPQDTPYHPAGVVDVTDYVTDVQWSHAVAPPWGGIGIQLAIPYTIIREILPGRRVAVHQVSPSGPEVARGKTQSFDAPRHAQAPEAGFWIVVGHANKGSKRKALGLFRCSAIDYGVVAEAGGHIATTPVSITGENFLSFLGRSHIQFSASGIGWGEEGFVYNLDSWRDGITAIIKSVLDEKRALGVILADLWPRICKITLPPSLSGQTMGSQIPVVYDTDTCTSYARGRRGVTDAVFGKELSVAGQLLPQQTILSFLGSLFGADQRLVEFFPSLEYPPDSYKPMETLLSIALEASQPVIVYRLRPWLVKEINGRNVSQELGREVTGTTACERAGIAQSADRPEYDSSDWREFSKNQFSAIHFGVTDADRVNRVAAQTFSADGSSMTDGLTGTALVRSGAQVKHHGLRPTTIHWPYFPSEASTALNDYADAITEIGWAFAAESERFCRGTVQAEYRPWLNAGHWIRLFFSDSCLTCYVEALTHNVGVSQGNGHVSAGTAITFSRGTLRYYQPVFGTSPEYQTPLMTQSMNDISAGPAALKAYSGPSNARKETEAHKALTPMKADPGTTGFAIYLNPGKAVLPGKEDAAGVTIKSGAVLSTQVPRFIVIHQTDTADQWTTNKDGTKTLKKSGVESMLTTWLKDGKKSAFYKGTNYSVDRDGTVIEWADPAKYYTNNSKSGGFTPRSIGIDFVLVGGQQLTVEQKRSGSRLITKLVEQFKMQTTQGKLVAPQPPAKVRGEPEQPKVFLTDAQMDQYVVFRHDMFARTHKATACCGTINTEELVSYVTKDAQPASLIAKTADETTAYIGAIVAKAKKAAQ